MYFKITVIPENPKYAKFPVGICENSALCTQIVCLRVWGLARCNVCTHFEFLSMVISVMVATTESVENRVFLCFFFIFFQNDEFFPRFRARNIAYNHKPFDPRVNHVKIRRSGEGIAKKTHFKQNFEYFWIIVKNPKKSHISKFPIFHQKFSNIEQ